MPDTQSAGSRYGIRVRRGECEWEVWGDEEFVRQQHTEWLKGAGAATASPGIATGLSRSGNSKKLSLAEFLHKVKPQKHPSRILAMAYYLEKSQGLSSFTRLDVVQCYTDAKEKYSTKANIYRDFARCESHGWVMPLDRKNGDAAYQVTATGEQEIEARLKGAGGSED